MRMRKMQEEANQRMLAAQEEEALVRRLFQRLSEAFAALKRAAYYTVLLHARAVAAAAPWAVPHSKVHTLPTSPRPFPFTPSHAYTRPACTAHSLSCLFFLRSCP